MNSPKRPPTESTSIEPTIAQRVPSTTELHTASAERNHGVEGELSHPIRQRSFLKELVRVLLPVAILFVGLGSFLALGSRDPEPRIPPETNQAPTVETVTVTGHDAGLDIEIDGNVVPFRQIELSAEVAGRIARKTEACRAGTYVTKGTLLLEIDPRDYQLEIRRLEEELNQADASLTEFDVELANTKAQIELAEEELALQRKNLARVLELAKKSVAAEAEIDLARREELTARNALRTLKNQWEIWKPRRTRAEMARELAVVELEKAKLDLQRTKLTAPVDGSIVSDPVDEGEFVQKGTLLVTVNDTSSSEIRCSLKMDELFWLWKQHEQAAALSSEGNLATSYEIPKTPVTVVYGLEGHQYVWDGVLSRYEGNGLDPQTRTVPCRVLVPSPRDVSIVEPSGATRRIMTGPRSLVSGMFVTVKIHATPKAELLRVPARALRPGKVVWKINDGKLVIQKVHVVESTQDEVILHSESSNLNAGDAVIVSPLPVVTSGMPVRDKAAP